MSPAVLRETSRYFPETEVEVEVEVEVEKEEGRRCRCGFLTAATAPSQPRLGRDILFLALDLCEITIWLNYCYLPKILIRKYSI
jgi:hypothetical protein